MENTGNYIEKSELPFIKDIRTLEKPVEQTHILLSFRGIPIEHEDHYPLHICSFVLGTGPSSMLGRRIREELGLVYAVESFLIRFLDGGSINISMSLAPSSQKRAIEETLSIVKSFGKNLTDRQVAIAKEKLASGFIMSREQPQSSFSATGYNMLLLGKQITDDSIIEGVRRVTTEDVKIVAEKYFDIGQMSFTAVGNTFSKEEYINILK
jgi:predicted Zn-dependent peptidase